MGGKNLAMEHCLHCKQAKKELQEYIDSIVERVIGEDETDNLVAVRPFGYKKPHSMQKAIKQRHRNKLRESQRQAYQRIKDKEL
jgi:hypothetical protein